MKIEKLYPVCKDYLWGGNQLKELYHKMTDQTPCAESWELSFHTDGKTCLENGKTLEESVTAQELGEKASAFTFFPTLIKFIDAKDNLSVQVHPSDEYALKNENSYGKTETWYIVSAEQGAGIYLGFNKDVSEEEFALAIQENRLTELLNFYPVQAGECYFIPSGTIHAIGAGCLIYEIQQNSNITYRVYDYGRVDKNGNPRELHVKKALAVTSREKFTAQVRKAKDNQLLAECAYFSVRSLFIAGERTLRADKDSFLCLTCVQGEGKIDGQSAKQGDSFFVPADYGNFSVDGDMLLLQTKIQ